MKANLLRAVEPKRDFPRIAELFSLEMDAPTTEAELHTDYEATKDRVLCIVAAEDEQGRMIGFNWATRSSVDRSEANIHVIVLPECRGHGVGRALLEDLERAARSAGLRKLKATVRDNFPEYYAFARARGFQEYNHYIGMTLDLARLDDRPYDALTERLKGEGFQFTTMEALGNTEEAQRKLYTLNDTAASETPGSQGVHSWSSFEDFRASVCGADWYNPASQFIVIESSTGTWVSMSAITRFSGTDYAYNLFTGTDSRYRGRKLAQAVKVLALRYARDVLKVNVVKTHHNAKNDPMIAIDRKLGYEQTPGSFALEKFLE